MNYNSSNYNRRRNTITRKHSIYRQNGGASLPVYANTFHGLHKWYEAKFEKLGWMVLAKEKGYDYKLEAYKLSLDDLLKSIEHVMAEYEDNDRKHDLQVLHDNTRCLQDFVEKTL